LLGRRKRSSPGPDMPRIASFAIKAFDILVVTLIFSALT
jgi:hypothetical protein